MRLGMNATARRLLLVQEMEVTVAYNGQVVVGMRLTNRGVIFPESDIKSA